MEDKIKLEYVHGRVLVWNAEDARVLREEYRIVGTLVGCLPRAPRQNVHLGLPLQLMPEETQLLLQKGYAELVMNKTDSEPDESKKESFQKMRSENFKEQIELFKHDRKREIYRNLNKIQEGKKAKRRKLMEERRKAGEEVTEEEDSEEEFDVETIHIPPVSQENSMVQIFTESPWRDTRQPAGSLWTFPDTDRDRLRSRVFVHLWEQGYFMTGGGKFGGDFLVYPGDPSRFHSFYIAICKPSSERMTALDIISMGRLGSNVKKTVLLCSVDRQDKVVCTSLQWTGIN